MNQTGIALSGQLISLEEAQTEEVTATNENSQKMIGSAEVNEETSSKVSEEKENTDSESENTATETLSNTTVEKTELIKPVLSYELADKDKEWFSVWDTVTWRISLQDLQENQSYTVKMKSDSYQTRLTDKNSLDIKQSTKRWESRLWQFDNPSQTWLTIDIVTRIDSLPPADRDEDICGWDSSFGESVHSFWDSSISVFSEGMTVKDRECLVISS